MCTAEGDSSLSSDPLCVCNCYKPSCDCDQSSTSGTDDNYAKKSAVVSLQAEMEKLRQELKGEKNYSCYFFVICYIIRYII